MAQYNTDFDVDFNDAIIKFKANLTINDIYFKLKLQMLPDRTDILLTCEIDDDIADFSSFFGSATISVDMMDEEHIFEKFKNKEWLVGNPISEYVQTLDYSFLARIAMEKLNDDDINFDDVIKKLIQELLEKVPDDTLIKSATKLS
jgi:hypothetical protein